MAKHVGKAGRVKVGANTVANTISWQFTDAAPEIDTSVMGDTRASSKAGLGKISGSFETLWDPTDATGQGALSSGASVTLNLYPDGVASGDYYYTMTAEILEESFATGVQDTVKRNYTFVVSDGTGYTENTV